MKEERIFQKVVAVIRFLIGFLLGAFVAVGLIFRSPPVLYSHHFDDNPELILMVIFGFGIVGGTLLITIWKHV